MIDEKSHIPFYKQISSMIKRDILAKKLNPGNKLKSIKELTEEFGISRVTAVKIIEDLVKSGLVITKQGKGTFVKAEPYINIDLLALQSLNEIQEITSVRLETKIIKLETIEMPLEIKNNLTDVFKESSEVIHIDRIHMEAERPVALCSIYLPEKLVDFSALSVNMLERISMFEYLKSTGVFVSKAIQKIKAISAEYPLDKYLKIKKGEPVLFAERISYDENGQSVMFARFYFRGDSYSYKIQLQR